MSGGVFLSRFIAFRGICAYISRACATPLLKAMSLLNDLVVTSLPLIPKSIVGQVSKRYVAGNSLQDAVSTVKRLNSQGFLTTLDLLGEDIHETESAAAMRTRCVEMFSEINRSALRSNVSVKLSQLGLRISREFCYENVRKIAEAARGFGNFVRIDMEDSTTTTDTLEIHKRLRGEGFENVGVVIQASMKRSEDDVRHLVEMGTNIRVCKGIYIEHDHIAYRNRDDVRRNFLTLVSMIVEHGCYVGIATHDEYLVDHSYEFLRERNLANDRYEFQMLLGVQEGLRDSIRRAGHRLRVYVPFGEQWYAYCVRRLKENPQIAGYVVRAMFS